MYFEEFKKQGKIKFNIKITIVICIVLLLISFFTLYKFNNKFRTFVNNILMLKPSINMELNTLYVSQDDINGILGYDKYFAILEQNTLKGYSNSDKEEFVEQLNITTPISYSKGKYLIVSEKGSNKIYLFEGKNLVYEKEVEGTISKVTVNKNGYVAVGMNKSGYRSVINLYKPDGEGFFTTYLATTYASDIVISDNNKLMAISEIDTSGIQTISRIKFVKIDKIDEQDNMTTMEKENDVLISKIQFANNNELVYYTDKQINKIDLLGNKTKILDITGKNILNADISLGKYIVVAQKSADNIFNNNTDIIAYNTDALEIGRYTIEGTIKQLAVRDNIICANIGQEIHFMSATCRPIKKYKSDIDIKDVILYDSSNMVALIYRNKIEIMNI